MRRWLVPARSTGTSPLVRLFVGSAALGFRRSPLASLDRQRERLAAHSTSYPYAASGSTLARRRCAALRENGEGFDVERPPVLPSDGQ